MNYEVYISAEDAAKIIRLSASTLAKLRCKGGGPVYYKLGRRVAYKRSDLDAWANSKLKRNTSEYE